MALGVGCSTGEEVYTMSIVLEEVNMLYKSKILATDLSTKALSKARTGKYSKNLMKNYLKPFLKFFPDRNIEKHFDLNDDNAKIKPRYQNKVTFKKHNLVGLNMDKKFDIIFCRNVLIYFDTEFKARILSMFNDSLTDNGYLVLGYYDTMPNQSIDIFDVYDNSTRIYKKKLEQNQVHYEQESINC